MWQIGIRSNPVDGSVDQWIVVSAKAAAVWFVSGGIVRLK